MWPLDVQTPSSKATTTQLIIFESWCVKCCIYFHQPHEIGYPDPNALYCECHCPPLLSLPPANPLRFPPPLWPLAQKQLSEFGALAAAPSGNLRATAQSNLHPRDREGDIQTLVLLNVLVGTTSSIHPPSAHTRMLPPFGASQLHPPPEHSIMARKWGFPLPVHHVMAVAIAALVVVGRGSEAEAAAIVHPQPTPPPPATGGDGGSWFPDGHRTVRKQGGPRHGRPDVGVCTSTTMAGTHWPSDTSSLKSVQVSTPAACETVCCETMGCGHWAFTTSEPAGYSNCLTGGPCCWLKGGMPTFPTAPNINCTVGVLTSIPNSTSTVRTATSTAHALPRCASLPSHPW